MRTRFLNIDYFASSTIGTPKFLSLPVPFVSSTAHLSSNEDHLRRLDSLEELPHGIERLQIEEALLKFLSDVIPDRVDVEYGDFHVNGYASGFYCLDETWSCNVDNSLLFEEEVEALYETKDLESRSHSVSEPSEKANQTRAEKKHNIEVCQFEIPELDLVLGNNHFDEKEDIQIPSEVQEIRNALDETVKLQDIFPVEAQQAIYLVDYISSEYVGENNASELEGNGAFQNQMLLQSSRFPVLEVEEMSSSIQRNQSVENELRSILGCVSYSWSTEDKLLTNGKELLGSEEYDIMEFLSDGCHLKQCPESEETSEDMFMATDIVNILETLHAEGCSGYHQNVDFNLSAMPVKFEEFQVLDMQVSKAFHAHFFLDKTTELEGCDSMFKEEMNFKNFDELIVSHELALADDTFKSLPIPVLSNHDKIKSLYSIVEKILLEQKPKPLSVSDKIYLDWHVLDTDEDNCTTSSSYHYAFSETDYSNITFDWEFLDAEKLVFDFILPDGAVNPIPNGAERYEETSKVISDGVSIPEDHFIGVTGESLANMCSKEMNGEQLGDVNAEKASSLFKSMSTFDDLAFFLNPRNTFTGGNESFVVEASRAPATYTEVSSNDPTASCMSIGMQTKQLDVFIHNVKLSENIIALVGNLERSYLAILQNDTELISMLPSNKSQVLSVPKEKLEDCISKLNARGRNSVEDEKFAALATLLAMKQISWYLCFYGIHVTHLYVDKLCRSLNSMRLRLENFYSLIDVAHQEVEKDITQSHPSLTVIQRVIQSNTGQSHFKVLIFSEQVFWCSLKRLLISIGMSCNELCSFYKYSNVPDVSRGAELTVADIDSLLVSDCLLASHEQVFASFPFDKFSLILEYGGSNGSPRISSPRLASLPSLHFIKLEWASSSACAALCEGINMPDKIKMTNATESKSEVYDEITERGLEEFMNFLPLENTCSICSSETGQRSESFSVPLESGLNTDIMQNSSGPFPSAVVIVNMQNDDKVMIGCRRSTYQKILAMEKGGVQVIERDLDLPVDLIFSSSICLLWYHCRNIREKNTPDDVSSSRPLCMENIATNVLTLLSFSFSCCILIFEGEANFLSAVMESSDELYAAAGSLGIELQLFCSFSADLTDEIILNCIGRAVHLTKGLYTKMPESETLAESFLTKFPSVNPLTAHAILSSGGRLIDFFKLSQDRRIQKLQKYFVPDESVNLFSVLCTYGERDDSKSVMTDCSSSFSSGPESDTCHVNFDSVSRTQKHPGISEKIDTDADDLSTFEPSNQFTNGLLNPSEVFRKHDSWPSKDPGMFDEYKKYVCLDDILKEQQTLDFAIEKNLCNGSGAYASQIHKGSWMPVGKKKWDLHFEDEVLAQNKGPEAAATNNLDWGDIKRLENLYKNNICEDLADSLFPGEGLSSSTANLTFFSPLLPEMERDHTRKPDFDKRLSFGSCGYPSFPTASEINSSSETLADAKETRENLRRIDHNADKDGNGDVFSLKRPKNLMHEVLARRSMESKGLPFRDERSHCSGTPLSNAVQSSHPQPGSPWTIEFLNRIREKTRMRQQAIPCYSSSPVFRGSGNVSKVTKRKSPSMLAFFKYQGGTAAQVPRQKKQKQSGQSSSSSTNERYPISLVSRTPIDKRAKRTLSFAADRSESQSKLVWS